MYEENADNLVLPLKQAEEQPEIAADATYTDAVQQIEEKKEERGAQNAAENARFAQQRRRQEYEDKFFKENISWMHNPQTGKNFENNSEWESFKKASAPLHSMYDAKMPPQQNEGAFSEMRKGILENDPEIAKLRQDADYARHCESQRMFSDMLTEIKAEYPDENAKHIIELGETFLRMCASGVDAVTAYEAVRKKAGARVNAPGMGDIGKSTCTAKDYFTPEEVDRMSNAEIEKNYALIRESMTQWSNDNKINK